MAAPNPDPDLLESSRAIESDLYGELIISDDGVAPVDIVRKAQPQSRLSPLMVSILALVSLSLIVAGLWGINDQSTTTPVQCDLVTRDEVTVRTGPGDSYEAAWTLSAGDLQAVWGRTEDGWLQLTHGWIQDVNGIFQRQSCLRMDVISRPHIFDDTLTYPTEIQNIDWEVSGESFATPDSGWTDITTDALLQPVEGALELSAGMRASPTSTELPSVVNDGFLSFRVEWLINEPQAVAFLDFRSTSEGVYRIEMRQNGTLALLQQDADRTLTPLGLDNNALPADGPFVIGVLLRSSDVKVFVDGQLALSADNIRAAGGKYYLGVGGLGAVVRINRFDVLTPESG